MSELYCPQCQKEMFAVPHNEGLWTCSSCRKIWIEQFESDFNLKNFKKLKYECPSCESALSNAQDEKGIEKFIFCEECLGLQLSSKQTYIFHNDELTKLVQSNFKQKQKKSKPKANAKRKSDPSAKEIDPEQSAFQNSGIVMKVYLMYLILLGLASTVVTVMPENFVPDLLGMRIQFNFVKVPYLEDFPMAITGLLVIFPTFILTLKEMRVVKLISYFYFIILHMYLLWAFYPLLSQYIKL